MAGSALLPASLADRPLRVGVLVDLPWSPTAGGHVKTWERIARAALATPEALELTKDHDVTNMLASTLARETSGVQFLEFAEYNYRDHIVRSHEFVVPSRDDVVLVLSAQERQLKADLLDAYVSERANLRHIEIGRERFRPLARYDYSRPPHASPLFYERFQWIPFHHPRVDFTSPAQICAAMARFRQASGG